MPELAPHMVFTVEATHIFLPRAVISKCCGKPNIWFVNRDGRTLCWFCDQEKYAVKFGRVA